MNITGIILAGGRSQRMGTNKALLEIEGKKNIERIVDVLRKVTNTIYIAANEREPYEFLRLPIVADQVAESGPLAGMQSAMIDSHTEYYFVVACDLPFLSAKAIIYMMEQCNGYEGVVPLVHGRMHPLCAIYHRSILPIVEEHLQKKDLKVMNVLSKLHIRYVGEQEFGLLGEDGERLFFNMNNRDDYNRVISEHALIEEESC